MADYMVELKEKSAETLSLSGGKGANLSKLHSIPDINVPEIKELLS